MNLFADAFAYILDNWSSGTAPLETLVRQHLWYSLLAVLGAAAIAVPLGLLVGHTRKGEVVLVGMVNALRALPTLGLLTLLVLVMKTIGLGPPLIALIVAGVPPLLAGTYAGLVSVDRNVVDAARAMGMTESQILFRVEVPNGLPLILGGLRSAALQVIATATVAAYVNLGGLGQPIFSGIALRNYDRVLAAAILVAALAVVIDGLLALAVRASVPGRPLLARR